MKSYNSFVRHGYWIVICAMFLFACGEQREIPNITLPAGFEIQHLYSPSENGQGSWVSMTTDDQGRLITSDQYGSLYYVEPPAVENPGGTTKVTPIQVTLGRAHGLLWAFNSLYVMVNSHEDEEEELGYSSGLYRITDSDSDGELDKVALIRKFKGHGEHGPHTILLSPDGQSLYLIGGNHTELPAPFTSLLPEVWDEDNLFPPMRDPRGHAITRMAPGGWVARIDPEGKEWELISAGYRNPFDMAFTPLGELLIFDSDMEWDLGMPWYRPIRVCHVTSGSEYGWRRGSGKWPAYYPDNLPPVINVGQGSPTGVIMGTGAKFPAKYQQGLFIFDWSFGTMYLVNLTINGATYGGNMEEFLSGVPLPLTDGVIGKDGAMYFATGGRRTDSDLYRVVYTGAETTAPVDHTADTLNAEMALRRELESHHGKASPEAVALAWANLDHADRFIRYAARIALEHQPFASWQDRLWKEANPLKLTQAMLAFARHGEAASRDRALTKLASVNFGSLNEMDKLALIRAHGLIGIRMGKPAVGQVRDAVLQQLDAALPSNSEALNRELSQLLVFMESSTVVNKTLNLIEGPAETNKIETAILSESMTERSKQYGPAIAEMLANMPPAQEIALANTLSHATAGWTPEDRVRYFQWYYKGLNKSGGASYKGFLDDMRLTALGNVPEADKDTLAKISGDFMINKTVDLANLPQPKGPGKAWNAGEIGRLLSDHEDEARNFEQGKLMFAAALCQSCHVMGAEGGITGPSLTQANTRFSKRDLVRAITLPSDEISDQYAATLITLKSGKTVVGRIVDENADEVKLNQNPYDPRQSISVSKAEIQNRELSPVSMMPGGLLNSLNEEEVMDLIAYLMAGGQEDHKLYSEK